MKNKAKGLSLYLLMAAVLLITGCGGRGGYPLRFDNLYYFDPQSGAAIKYSSEAGYTEKEIAVVEAGKVNYPELTKKYITIPCGLSFSSKGQVNANIAYAVVNSSVVLATPTGVEAPFDYMCLPGDTSRILIWVDDAVISVLDLASDTAQAVISPGEGISVRALAPVNGGDGLLYEEKRAGEAALFIYDFSGGTSSKVADFNGYDFLGMEGEEDALCASVVTEKGVSHYSSVQLLDLKTGSFEMLYENKRRSAPFGFAGAGKIYTSLEDGRLELTDYKTGESITLDAGSYTEVYYASINADGKYMAVLKDVTDEDGFMSLSLITLNLETGDMAEHYNSLENDDFQLYFSEWHNDRLLAISYLSNTVVNSGYTMIKQLTH